MLMGLALGKAFARAIPSRFFSGSPIKVILRARFAAPTGCLRPLSVPARGRCRQVRETDFNFASPGRGARSQRRRAPRAPGPALQRRRLAAYWRTGLSSSFAPSAAPSSQSCSARRREHGLPEPRASATPPREAPQGSKIAVTVVAGIVKGTSRNW